MTCILLFQKSKYVIRNYDDILRKVMCCKFNVSVSRVLPRAKAGFMKTKFPDIIVYYVFYMKPIINLNNKKHKTHGHILFLTKHGNAFIYSFIKLACNFTN